MHIIGISYQKPSKACNGLYCYLFIYLEYVAFNDKKLIIRKGCDRKDPLQVSAEI
jgi:hypothetical protein